MSMICFEVFFGTNPFDEEIVPLINSNIVKSPWGLYLIKNSAYPKESNICKGGSSEKQFMVQYN